MALALLDRIEPAWALSPDVQRLIPSLVEKAALQVRTVLRADQCVEVLGRIGEPVVKPLLERYVALANYHKVGLQCGRLITEVLPRLPAASAAAVLNAYADASAKALPAVASELSLLFETFLRHWLISFEAMLWGRGEPTIGGLTDRSAVGIDAHDWHKDSDPIARALGALAVACQRESLPADVIPWLSDPSPSVREMAAVGLARLDNPEAAAPIVEALIRETDDWAQSIMIAALRRWPTPAVVLGLLKFSARAAAVLPREGTPEGLSSARQYLQAIRDASPLHLITALESPDASVRQWALRSLAGSSSTAVLNAGFTSLLDSVDVVSDTAAICLAASSSGLRPVFDARADRPQLVVHLVNQLFSSEAAVATSAFRVLEVSDPDWFTQCLAREAALRRVTEGASPFERLLALLKTRSYAAAIALYWLAHDHGQPGTAAALVEASLGIAGPRPLMQGILAANDVASVAALGAALNPETALLRTDEAQDCGAAALFELMVRKDAELSDEELRSLSQLNVARQYSESEPVYDGRGDAIGARVVKQWSVDVTHKIRQRAAAALARRPS